MRHLDRRLHKIEASTRSAVPAVRRVISKAKEDESEEAAIEYLRLVAQGMTDTESRARGYRMDPSVTCEVLEDLRVAGVAGGGV
jgi:hypothetical protein